jgi:diguanylate cyclase (GGDEF)-like protein
MSHMKALLHMAGALTLVWATPSTADAPTDPVAMATDAVSRARDVMMTKPAAARRIGDDLARDLGRLPESRPRTTAMARAHWISGEAATRQGDTQAARRLLQDALDEATRSGDRSAQADALLSRGSLMHSEERPSQALLDYLKAARLYRLTGNARSQAITLQYLGVLYDEAADHERAKRYLDQAGMTYSEPRMNVSLAVALGDLAQKRGDGREAVGHYRKAVLLAGAAGDMDLLARVRVGQASAMLSNGQVAAAARVMRLADGEHSDTAIAVRSLILLAQGRTIAAVQEISKGNPLRSDRDGERRTMLHEAAYKVYRAAGRPSDALVQYETVARSREEMTALALSSKAALMATQFDYAGQELRIEKLRAGEMRRRYDDQKAATENQRAYMIMGALGAYTLVVLLTYGIITLRRSRNNVRQANARLEDALREARASGEEARHAIMLAEHDTLTGLPNRRHLHQRLAAEFEERCGDGTHCAVLLLDLDRFKAINDINGHQVGDAVLLEVARRLTALCQDRGAYTVRLGGDEFLIVVIGAESEDVPEEIAKEVLDVVGAPYEIEDRRHELGTSIGIARYGRDGDTVTDLMRAADIAMYEAKRAGRNTYRHYDTDLDERVRDRLALEDELRRAVRDGGIEAWFQPITDLQTGAVTGFEALARWDHPVRGMISPDVFIPIAEEIGVIDGLTTTILQQACRTARTWPDEVTVSVNISPSMLRDSWIVAKTFALLTQERLDPSRLIVEITENAVIGDLDFARDAIDSFRQSGIKVALDDFGCGYSSLSMLRQLRFDHLKLDRSFSQNIHDEESLKITRAVAGLTKAMGMTSTAEGVETQEAADILTGLGFDRGQGYLYGRPAPEIETRITLFGGDQLKVA